MVPRPGTYARSIGHDPHAAYPRRPAGSHPSSPDGTRLDLAVQTFALLADRTRLLIVWHLRGRELSVNEIAGRVDKSPATVSQHLGKLRLAGIVSPRRDGNFIHYRLTDDHIAEVVEDAVYHAEHLQPGDA
ncbi:MAG: ArsR/SmtB family transcription factor [Acidimicrobiales bacterium]